jgi:hypothetical protein
VQTGLREPVALQNNRDACSIHDTTLHVPGRKEQQHTQIYQAMNEWRNWDQDRRIVHAIDREN